MRQGSFGSAPPLERAVDGHAQPVVDDEGKRGAVVEVPRRRVLNENLLGDTRERKRWIKNRLWYRFPRFVRAYAFFFYSYVIKLGFLDGRVGLVYHTLQAFWFRFLVDAKVEEQIRRADERA